ncbi:MAG TPA: hypothetical protein VIG08_08115 [Gemmatimonadales bacterium]|jgi:hypothetical protein
MLLPRSRRIAGGMRAVALTVFAGTLGACGATDQLDPDAGSPPPQTPEMVSANAVAPGVVFASFDLDPSAIGTVHTGTVRPTTPSSVILYLNSVRAKKGRVLLKLHGDNAVRNSDKSFNLDKWKTEVGRFKNVNITSYIADGTIVGHFLLDEPHFPSRWGNKTIPQATVEAMATYSKQLWPNMPTIVNAPPSWLDDQPVTYTNLDAGWAMFMGKSGTAVTKYATNQANAAKKKGLGLIAGLNVLDGGDGSSGFPGNYPNKFAMSAAELRSYGAALLAQIRVCGFVMWKFKSSYYDRADIKSAMTEISAKARSHAATSCKQ